MLGRGLEGDGGAGGENGRISMSRPTNAASARSIRAEAVSANCAAGLLHAPAVVGDAQAHEYRRHGHDEATSELPCSHVPLFYSNCVHSARASSEAPKPFAQLRVASPAMRSSWRHRRIRRCAGARRPSVALAPAPMRLQRVVPTGRGTSRPAGIGPRSPRDLLMTAQPRFEERGCLPAPPGSGSAAPDERRASRPARGEPQPTAGAHTGASALQVALARSPRAVLKPLGAQASRGFKSHPRRQFSRGR